MSTGRDILIKPISERQFELFALSLANGPNFGSERVFACYQVGSGSAAGCLLVDPESGRFSTLAIRRRVDHCWMPVDEAGGFGTPEAALDHLSFAMRGGDPPEPLPAGSRRRRPLLKIGPRGRSAEFDLLVSSMTHLPALMAVGECYLALPRPDANFVSDFQTRNFASRLFELYLLACFREQGLTVRQDHASPDFWIAKDGASCWVEAVTANSDALDTVGVGDWVHAPTDRTERLSGEPAERFAKTLRGKLQRGYHQLAHVAGQPFAIAIADFHKSGSMVWSREALPTYLYGERADVHGHGKDRRAVGTRISSFPKASRNIPSRFSDC